MLTLAVVRTNYGIWRSAVALGDLSTHIQVGFDMHQKGTYSANLYLDGWTFIFNHISPDPIVAYYILRFLASLLSVIGLFLLFSYLPKINSFGAFALALLWNLNIYNVPHEQYGIVNVLAFAISCFACAFWLAYKGKRFRWIFPALLIVLAFMRIEYSIWLALWGAREIIKWLRGPKVINIRKAIVIGAVLIIAGGPYILSGQARKDTTRVISYADNYLFNCMGQAYVSNCVLNNNQYPGFDWAAEYYLVIDKVFPNVKGFYAAFLSNPKAVLWYFTKTSYLNILKLSTIIQHHSIVFPSIIGGLCDMPDAFIMSVVRVERWIICFFLAVCNIWLLFAFIRKYSYRTLIQLWDDDRLFPLVSLGVIALPAIVLLIPDHRHLVTLIPLIYLGSAVAVSNFSKHLNTKAAIALAIALMIIFSRPVFLYSPILNPSTVATDTRNSFIFSVRAKLAGFKNSRPRFLGYQPQTLIQYAAPCAFDYTDIWRIKNGVSYEELTLSKAFDFILIDYSLRLTKPFRVSEKRFFKSFMKRPEIFGYKLSLINRSYGTLLYERKI